MPTLRINLLTAAAAGLLLGLSGPALAHVDYADLNAFPTQSDSFNTKGWFLGTDNPASGCSIDGTSQCLGDSHDLRFFKFTLSQDSWVTIAFSANATNSGGLNPAFSLYQGLLPNESHDDTPTDPLNAVDGDFEPVQHPTDSAYWDSNNVREGQFNALGTWSMANDEGEWAEITYITHVNANSAAGPGASETLLNYLLAPGSYTVAAAGASTAAVSANRSGTVSFSATPVPVPAAVWLMGSALAGLGAFRRRSRPAA
jgi:hypothetical protein